MRIVLIILGSFAVLALGYFFYQVHLGAVPFLVGSIILFYFGYRLIPRSSIDQADNISEEETPDNPLLLYKKSKVFSWAYVLREYFFVFPSSISTL